MTFIYIIFTAVLLGLGGAIFMNKRRKSKVAHLDVLEEISMGKYLAGFAEHTSEIKDIFCNVTNECFHFSSIGGKKIGIIDRDATTNIFIEDKSTVGQRLTATRLLTLGIFSLAVPKKKKHKEYCIVFEWDDNNAEKNNAVFEFTGFVSDEIAKESFNKLNKYRPITTKKCPFCDEIIKVKAKVCKHCKKEIE